MSLDAKVKALETKMETVHEETAVDPVAEKKLLRKIDLYLMPSVFILYLFSYVVSMRGLTHIKRLSG